MQIRRLSPFFLKSEGVPVYRCIQHPREFVLVFPGAYHSAFDCGFNVVEAVNFAPPDWLPHGQNAVTLYQEQGRKTSISFDKLLIGAAREAVKVQWELCLLRKNTSDNLRWKGTCGKDGILAKTLKSRVKQEGNRREYLCPTSQMKRMDKNFNATGKRECSICFFDLYLSAARCPCSADRYSCLNHAKQLCSCTWTEKIFLYHYEISELNILVEALEGKLSAVYRWARKDLNLAIRHCTPKGNSCTEDKGRKEHAFQDAGTSYGNGWSTAASIEAELKARLWQSQYLNAQKSKEKTVSSPSAASLWQSQYLNAQKSKEKTVSSPSAASLWQSQYLNAQKSKENTVSSSFPPSMTQDDTSFLLREMMPEALSSSTSVSSCSESETADLGVNDGGKGHISSTFSASPPSRPQREVILSELLKDISSKHDKAKQSKSTSKRLPVSHPASKKRRKK